MSAARERHLRLLTPRPAEEEDGRRSRRTGNVQIPVVLAYMKHEPIVDVDVTPEKALELAGALIAAASTALQVRTGELADLVLVYGPETVDPGELADRQPTRDLLRAAARTKASRS